MPSSSRTLGGMAMDEGRLVKIESALAHMEQLTETLNETIIEQDKTIRRLSQQVEQLTNRLASDDMNAIKENVTKPPHY
ncbi:MAG: SlyX family protein [Verrucomicrobiota bacterium]|nr:SlyX family protein [Verrucomicrobiota bacterium]